MGIVRAWRQVLLGGFAALAVCVFVAVEAVWVVVATIGGAHRAGYIVIWLVLGATLLVAGTAALVRWFGANRAEVLFGGTLMLVIVDAAAFFYTFGMLSGA
jgi:hypothetical protein